MLIIEIIMVNLTYQYFLHKEINKEKNAINKKQFAMYINNGDGYKEYKGESLFPKGYYLNKDLSHCEDIKGNEIENVISAEGNKITITSNKTIYCTLYFETLFKGKGTEEEPYQINVIEDLVKLSNSVNKDNNTYNGEYFELTGNLDFENPNSYENSERTDFGDINGINETETLIKELTDPEGSGFIPIGFFGKTYEGNIDGKNNKISNLWININKNELITNPGFIGYLKNGSVSNLTLVGEIKTIVNSSLGGLVNRIENSTVDNCVNEVNVISNNGNYAIGGLVGWSSGSAIIKNSVNKGNITNGGYTAGVIAGNQGGTLTIENCKNYGKIENNLGYVIGGITGEAVSNNANKTIIKNSSNNGEILINNQNDTTQYAGGVIGRSTKELEITNSHNEGIINVNGISSLNVGGLIGYSGNKTTITYSYNIGEINSSTSGNYINYTAGVVGKVSYLDKSKISKIENCYNKGNISGGNRTGGILGGSGGISNIIINKCYNTGNLTTQEDTIFAGASVSGLVCQIYSGSRIYILNSYNTGTLESNATETYGYASGIVLEINNEGSNGSSGIIINSYNLGNINAKNFSTGFAQTFTNIDFLLLNNVYNIGNIESTNKYIITSTHNTNSTLNIKNTYYKDVSGIQESNKGDIEEAYSMTDANMKNPDGNDQNSLLYKLNQNATNLNKVGLSSIDESIGIDLDGYKLISWKINPNTGYPTLDYNLETE